MLRFFARSLSYQKEGVLKKVEKEQIITEKVAKDSGKDWLLRFVKGMFIGSGFILPG